MKKQTWHIHAGWLLLAGITTQAQYTYTTLDDPLAGSAKRGQQGTFAQGISGANIVGFYYDTNGAGHGFLYNGGAWATLDDPSAVLGTFANGISGSNIVGTYDSSSFLYNGGVWTTLDYPGSGIFGGMAPSGISGANIVGAWAEGPADPYELNLGFLLNGTTYTTLDDPLASLAYFPLNGTVANGISGSNIVGSYWDTNGARHGFLYNGSVWTTLDHPSATGSGIFAGTSAQGISGANIVGSYYDTNGVSHGFLYDGSVWTTLDDPSAAGPGLLAGTFAQGISGANIVGFYYDTNGVSHGFLATPAIPRLTIGHAGGGVKVSWPYPSSGWTLRQNFSLDTTNWTASSGVSHDGTNNFIGILSPVGSLFFRLSQQ